MEFDAYLTRWGLTPDGVAIEMASSRLLRRGAVSAMLQGVAIEKEKIGGLLMVWWDR
jgi:streptomycin 6-kinase